MEHVGKASVTLSLACQYIRCLLSYLTLSLLSFFDVIFLSGLGGGLTVYDALHQPHDLSRTTYCHAITNGVRVGLSSTGKEDKAESRVKGFTEPYHLFGNFEDRV